MKPLTPQRKKELLIGGGVFAAAIALLYLRGHNAASSAASSTAPVDPLFDPSSLLGSGSGFDTASSLGGGGGSDTSSSASPDQIAAALAAYLPTSQTTTDATSPAAVAPTATDHGQPEIIVNVPAPVVVTQASPTNDTGGQATKAPTSSVARTSAPTIAQEAPKTQQLAASAAPGKAPPVHGQVVG